MSNNKKIIKQISKEERSLVKEVFLNIVISKNLPSCVLLGGWSGLVRSGQLTRARAAEQC